VQHILPSAALSVKLTMEGGGGNNSPERRTPRIVHDFDLNVKLEQEEQPELEQLPRNVCICGFVFSKAIYCGMVCMCGCMKNRFRIYVFYS
jgi:hypothetical protein